MQGRSFIFRSPLPFVFQWQAPLQTNLAWIIDSCCATRNRGRFCIRASRALKRLPAPLISTVELLSQWSSVQGEGQPARRSGQGCLRPRAFHEQRRHLTTPIPLSVYMAQNRFVKIVAHQGLSCKRPWRWWRAGVAALLHVDGNGMRCRDERVVLRGTSYGDLV